MRAPRRILRGGSVKKTGSIPAARGRKLGKDTMERHFEKDLQELKDKLLWMGTVAERAVHRAVHAVLDSEPKLAEAVLEEEDVINELQIEIDDRVVQLLALHQLMAVDLRLVLAVSRINNDLERIGDQAVNIAQSARSEEHTSELQSQSNIVC